MEERGEERGVIGFSAAAGKDAVGLVAGDTG